MPALRNTLIGIALAILGTIVTGIIGFLNTASLSVSFDKLKDFDPLNLSTYKALGTSLNFDVQTSEPLEFTSFYVDVNNGNRLVRRANIVLKNFKINHRVQGYFIADDGVKYSLSGYYNSDRMVINHRGPARGLGVYVLDAVQLQKIPTTVYVGFAIMENQIQDGDKNPVMTQCPYVMIDPQAPNEFLATDKIEEQFPLLKASCTVVDVPGMKVRTP
ncbi:hypothetical protein SAMN04487843_11598 [Methylobacterium sp. ap11]|uniref:hypothetical protein n=1 Tax=Methylobacterium sp. ap11 TaxID=1761799 RepID=UPI0008B8BBC8|nr:hypothetical protein [Methylobacterium sp. ap11]SEP39994.1 hypothetical protein SAMN04487843_11598 [Methylobacterium sp. ap11]